MWVFWNCEKKVMHVSTGKVIDVTLMIQLAPIVTCVNHWNTDEVNSSAIFKRNATSFDTSLSFLRRTLWFED